MSVWHCTGFESNGILTAHETFDSAGTVAVISSSPLTGTYSLQCNPTTTGNGWASLGRWTAAAWIHDNNATGTSPFVCGFKFKPVTLPSADSEEISACRSGGAAFLAGLRVTSAGNLQLYNSDGTTQTGSDSSTALSAGSTYYIEWLISAGTAGNCVGSVRINGTQEILTTTGTFGTSSADRDVYRLGKTVDRNGETVDFIYDDAYTGNTYLCAATATAGLWPQVVQIRPNAAGTHTAFTAGTNGSDYLEVDEVAPDTTTYMTSTAAGDIQTVNLQSCATGGISGTIHAVVGMTRSARNAAGGAWRMRLISGATTQDASSTTVGSAYTTSGAVHSVDPDTSSAWTTTGVDALQLGVIDDAGSTGRTRFTWAAANVLFSPAAGGGFQAAWARNANLVISTGARAR